MAFNRRKIQSSRSLGLSAALRVCIAAVLAIAAATLPLAITGCAKQTTPRPDAPKPRIVSFSPALTDMLFQMGLGDHVVGVTTQCILPPGEDRQHVGDEFNIKSEPILAVKPDLMAVQVRESKIQTIRQLMPDLKIEHFDVEKLADIPSAAARLAKIVGRPEVANEPVKRFNQQLADVRTRVEKLNRPRVLFVMGCKNPSAAGGDKFVAQMIDVAGGINVASDLTGWQNLNIETVIGLRPDVIVCWVDENYEKTDEARNYWLQLKDIPASQTGRVFAVADRYWTIPTLRTPEYIAKLADMIHGKAIARSESKIVN